MTNTKVLIGDVRERIQEIPDGSIQCVVTSPPYYGLRDYKTGTWDGGDAACDHMGEPFRTKENINQNCGTGMDVKNAEDRQFFRDVCGKCGAIRVDNQIGLESTPQAYVDEMVDVFREVRRVLADDGTLWLNIGDSYGESKNLLGIPWRVALALQDDGWTLRQDIIWSKPNPMPESVKDRCTKSHEYLFLLTKSPRYYYDAEAIKEPSKQDWGTRNRTNGKYHNEGTGLQPHSGLEKSYKMANKRSVWSIATRPYKGAHFAVMPEALVEPCILAGTKEGDTVLDPFAGSGTVLRVAQRTGRRSIGIELNPDYLPLIEERTQQQSLLLTQSQERGEVVIH